MKPWSFVLLISGVTLVVAGALRATYGASVMAVHLANSMQAGKWLPADNLLLALAAAVAGLTMLGLGAFLVLRQKAAQRAQKQQHEDRLRRVRDYRRDPNSSFDTFDGRREPFIGRDANRRVA
jgi:hypothetical protein